MVKTNRQDAVGALLDIYEQMILDLKKVIEDIPDNVLPIVFNQHTTNEDCKSIQAILSHVVNAGYGYATSINNIKGHTIKQPDKTFRNTIKEYLIDLDNVFAFTQNVFSNIKDSELEQNDNSLKIKIGSGQLYDIEQLTEHAIVHVLRHKRQIQKINYTK
ncbi:DinB family protein [Flavobacterium sp. 5]|uniref:DinB family protein n=1 Tax=Flavobacterium sp. 5 TaxID=2035199 RepID=UPI000C2C5AC7|nr:DinB family protein [Flavobacterium sp. 5]PKB18209.1 DinB family protein [Flavobacterium sp. 5]